MSYNNLRKGRTSQVGLVYHITAVTQNRVPYFDVLENGRKVVRQLIELQTTNRVETLCYVLMPDHLHWLMKLQEGNLSDVEGKHQYAARHAFGDFLLIQIAVDIPGRDEKDEGGNDQIPYGGQGEHDWDEPPVADQIRTKRPIWPQ